MNRVLTEAKLNKACKQYPNVESSIQAWKKLVKGQEWNSFTNVKATSIFAPAQVKNFVIFNIGGNKYRLITYIDYKNKIIFIRYFLTHAQYDECNWRNDEWFDNF